MKIVTGSSKVHCFKERDRRSLLLYSNHSERPKQVRERSIIQGVSVPIGDIQMSADSLSAHKGITETGWKIRCETQ